MLGPVELAAMVDVIALPMFGLWALLATKLSVGAALRRAERQFMLALVIISLVTLRTATRLDDAWLMHTITLAAMVLGVYLVPARQDCCTRPPGCLGDGTGPPLGC